MWDNQGLECMFDVNTAIKEHKQWEKSKIFSILKDEVPAKKPQGIPLNLLLLRARVNSQRQYEIYEFNSMLSYSEVKDQFDSNPQPLVEWIRQNGYKVYSDYSKGKKCMIV